MRSRFAAAVATSAMLAMVCVSADAPARPVTAQTLPLSPSVLATVANTQRLELLVLWRGTSGWYMSSGQRGASYSGSGSVLDATVTYGGVTLRFSFNARDATASLQGRRLSLPAGTNVLLVDGVDSSTGPRLVETLAVPADGPVDPRFDTLAPFLKRSPAMVAFLQCDAGTGRGDSDRMLRRIVCDKLSVP